MINPTIGRIVHFWEDRDQKEPIAAIITKVINDNLVHITTFPSMNVPQPYIDVPINREIKQYPYTEWPLTNAPKSEQPKVNVKELTNE